MCGIAALLQLDGSSCPVVVLRAMRDTMWHRGPDDAGLHVDGPIGLAHRRLSILDLSPAGHQPMSNEDGTVWITFNGEIYNYIELAHELRVRGHTFRSQSDTEVLVHLWEEYGAACLPRLNGMFAFVIWDARKQTLFAARDRMGIKPLYYAQHASHLAFASELKGLLAHPAHPAQLDRQGLADTLFAGAPLGRRTMFAALEQMPPGHYLLATRDGEVRLQRWWELRYDYRRGVSRKQRADELEELLIDAVRVHCRSDAPVGSHLSGGLDSSLVATLAARERGAMDVFSITFGEGAYYDESPYAEEVARAINARRRVITPTASDLERLMGTLTWHQEQPHSDTAGFSYFAASRLASEYVKVALTGHGGDEVFGGYPAQFRVAFRRADAFTLLAPTASTPSPGTLLRGLISRTGVPQFVRRLRGAAALPTGVAGRWIREHCGDLPDRHPLLHPSLAKALRDYSPVPDYLSAFREAPTDALFDRCLHHDLVQYLPMLLMKEDRASMAVSIESRVPLLDHRVVEWMATVPPEDKVPGFVPKALLRDVASRHLPRTVVERRDKSPFPIPVREWVRGALRPFAVNTLRSDASLERGIFNPDVLRRPDLDDGDLLQMLGVELWCRVFLDRDTSWRGTQDVFVRTPLGERFTRRA